MARVQSQGVEIYYECFGQGDTHLVFAHGMGGNGAVWYQQIAHLAERYRIITFDHRHFARSACTENQFLPALFPADVLAILDKELIEQAVFICQSMGGWTGSQMAVNHPDRTQALVMSHTPGIFVSADVDFDPAAVARTIVQSSGPFGSAALAPDFPVKEPAMALLYNQISSFNGINPAIVPRAIGQAGLETEISSIANYSIPTLFVTADHDQLFPAEYIRQLADRLPGAEFSNLGDAGHSSYFEIPRVFNARLDQFFASLALA